MNLDLNITFEPFPEPVLEFEFAGLKCYNHTKVLLNGDWCLTINKYQDLDVQVPVMDEWGDEVEEDDEPKEVVSYAVKARWDMLKVNHDPIGAVTEEDKKIPTIELARIHAAAAAGQVANFLREKMRLFGNGSEAKASKATRYRFQYGDKANQTVTVYATSLEEARIKAVSEMNHRLLLKGKVPPTIWALDLVPWVTGGKSI